MPRRPKRLALRWAKTASLDLRSIVDFLSQESSERAEHALGEIEKAASGLAIHPRRGRVVPELKDQGLLLYRELVLAPWRIVYRIEGRSVFVLAVLDSRRNLEDILLERFLH